MEPLIVNFLVIILVTIDLLSIIFFLLGPLDFHFPTAMRVSHPKPGILACDPMPRIQSPAWDSPNSCSRSANWAWDRPGGGWNRPGLWQPPPRRSHAHFAECKQEPIPVVSILGFGSLAKIPSIGFETRGKMRVHGNFESWGQFFFGKHTQSQRWGWLVGSAYGLLFDIYVMPN